jgi:Sulfotransferase domain
VSDSTLAYRADQAWRRLTWPWRALPDFVILGAQRGGTTSLFRWLVSNPALSRPRGKELHYFDLSYDRGLRWYRAQFPVRRHGRVTGESSPYMLFHPLVPGRAAHDLPPKTRYIVLLRDPATRAVSQYWHERRRHFETQTLARAIELEPERLAGQDEVVRAGGASRHHQHHSYVARGEYAGQLRAWFDRIPRERFLIVESERLFTDPAVADQVASWLGLATSPRPFPARNAAARTDRDEGEEADVVAKLRRHFEPYNRDLFELLGTTLWGGGEAVVAGSDMPAPAPAPAGDRHRA